MKTAHLSQKDFTALQVGVVILLLFLLAFIAFVFFGDRESNWLKTEYDKAIAKTRLVQTMRSELLASAEAEKSSVMADTDEASKAFAQQSERASQNVENARIAFEALIKNSDEAKPFDEFSACWRKLREIDTQILSRAVQNTNLKALRLFLGPAAAEMKRMQEALNEMIDRAAEAHRDGAEIIRLAASALITAQNIYILTVPHIVETTDAGMDGIEAKMRQLDERVRNALKRLEPLVGGAADKPLFVDAWNSYRAVHAINKEIVDLSRQNSNIRSFSESLGQKRQTMIMCLSYLDSLQEIVQENATFKATR